MIWQYVGAVCIAYTCCSCLLLACLLLVLRSHRLEHWFGLNFVDLKRERRDGHEVLVTECRTCGARSFLAHSTVCACAAGDGS